jgi:hypothetical protein
MKGGIKLIMEKINNLDLSKFLLNEERKWEIMLSEKGTESFYNESKF